MRTSFRFAYCSMVIVAVSVNAADPTTTPSPAPPTASATPSSSTGKVSVGELVSLQQDGQTFEGLYATETTGKRKGAALILPDLGHSNEAPEVIDSLRQLLLKSGWSTLAIPLPALESSAVRSSYGTALAAIVKRITAALTYLQSKDVTAVVLIGHGIGATAAAQFLAQGSIDVVKGFVAIGIDPAQDLTPLVDIAALFEKFKVPVLDIYGVRDHVRVRQWADRRREAARRGQVTYTRVALADATHHFTGLQLFLVNRVRGWMDKLLVTSQAMSPAGAPASPASP